MLDRYLFIILTVGAIVGIVSLPLYSRVFSGAFGGCMSVGMGRLASLLLATLSACVAMGVLVVGAALLLNLPRPVTPMFVLAWVSGAIISRFAFESRGGPA